MTRVEPFAALVTVAGADEASEDDVEASGESDSSEIGASEHVSTVTLFPDFPDQSARPPRSAMLQLQLMMGLDNVRVQLWQARIRRFREGVVI